MGKVAGNKLAISVSQKKKGTKTKGLGENIGVNAKVFQTSEQVGKRLASELSPKEAPSKKRAAFGDITNAVHPAQVGKNKKKRRSSKTKTKSSGVRNESTEKDGLSAKTDDVLELGLLSSSEEFTSSQEPSEYGSSQEQKGNDVEMEDLICEENIEETKGDNKSKSKEESKCEQVTTEASPTPDSDVTNIDADMSDPFMVSEYAYEIFENMKAREELFPLTSYMDRQSELTVSMRAILVDWLVEVQESFELYHETLYVGVKILDHYLMKCFVKREDLQLVGAVSLFIAAKFEERHTPSLDDFLYICDDAYKHSAVVEMERKILLALQFELNIPIPYRFLRRYARAASAHVKTLTLARFLLESTLHNYQFLEYKPSLLASACLYLALQMKKCGSWTQTLVHYTGYKLEELKECVLKLNAMNSEPPNRNLMTVRNKYTHSVFHEVARIPPIDMLALDFK